VPTPVWFVQDGEILYVRTGAVSGKIKRIRNNRQVRVAPCDMRGSLKGEWVEAQAELIEADVARRVNGLLDKKYGLMKKLFEWFTPSREGQSATVAIRIN
jgi:PPOX class probable F420-dependent enzyme